MPTGEVHVVWVEICCVAVSQFLVDPVPRISEVIVTSGFGSGVDSTAFDVYAHKERG